MERTFILQYAYDPLLSAATNLDGFEKHLEREMVRRLADELTPYVHFTREDRALGKVITARITVKERANVSDTT